MHKKYFILSAIVLICFCGVLFGFFWFMERGEQGVKTIIEEKEENPSALTSSQILINYLSSDEISWTDLLEQKKRERIKNKDVGGDVAFIDSLLGNLSEAENMLNEYCTGRQASACTQVPFDFTIRGPIDTNGKKISGTQFQILGKPGTQTKQNTYRTSLYKNIVFRTKVSKKGYTDFFSTEKFTPWENEVVSEQRVIIEPVLVPSQGEISIEPKEDFSVSTDSYVFEGSGQNFKNPDGSPVIGPIQIYFFDMSGDTSNFTRSQLLSLDIFSQSGKFIGSGMTTFGMPLVKAYSGDTELKIDPKNPVRVTGKIQDLYDFLIADGKTPDEIEKLYANIPLGEKITLEKAHEFQLPPYWRLDTDKGIWTDSSYTILDRQGNLEFFIY